MRNFFLQIVLFLAGAVITIFAAILGKEFLKRLGILFGVLLIVFALLWTGYELRGCEPQQTPTPPPSTSTSIPSVTIPTTPSSTLPPTTPSLITPTPTNNPDSTIYDDFNNTAYDNAWNTKLWIYNSEVGDTKIEQRDGVMMLSRQTVGVGGLYASQLRGIDELRFIEAKLKLDGNIQASGGVTVGINNDGWWISCNIFRGGDNAFVQCGTSDNYSTDSIEVGFNTWHILRLEINPDLSTVSFFLDDKPIGKYSSFKHTQYSAEISVWSDSVGLVAGYADDVRIWK